MRAALKEVAKETIAILERCEFIGASGELVHFGVGQKQAEEGTKLYTPIDVDRLIYSTSGEQQQESSSCAIEVTDETTQVAAHRLVAVEGCQDLVLLNFASARNPCGGFLWGAKSQEEDLARCSGLYTCQLTQPSYYDINRQQTSLLYTDHIIYSPKVPWFRTRSTGELLDQWFLASVITAPAPNARAVLKRNATAQPDIAQTLLRRAGYVLGIARDNGHRSLLLGAWGCGVFGNDPTLVADAFGQWLESDSFRGSFDRVVFAVYDTSKRRETLKAFQTRFDEHD
jgi:uncharacterized protein (TIGR02452 family)